MTRFQDIDKYAVKATSEFGAVVDTAVLSVLLLT